MSVREELDKLFYTIIHHPSSAIEVDDIDAFAVIKGE